MSKPITNEEILYLKSLVKKVEDSGTTLDEIFQIEDFSEALESEILNQLAALDEPVFTNPTTGKSASSVHAVLLALDYGVTVKWPVLVNKLRKSGSDAIFFRRDLPKSNPRWATICIDLDQVEDLLPTVQPKKAPRVISKFKTEHGLS